VGQNLTSASPWTPVAFHTAAQAPATSWASRTARRPSDHFTLGDGCRRRRTAASDPTNKEVADLIRQIRTENIPAVFGLEVFPSDVMRTITAESGAAYIDELNDDDLPGGPGDADHIYPGLAVSNLRIMIPALGGDTSAQDDIDVSPVFDGPSDAFYPQ